MEKFHILDAVIIFVLLKGEYATPIKKEVFCISHQCIRLLLIYDECFVQFGFNLFQLMGIR